MTKCRFIFMGMAVTLFSVNCLAQNGFTVKPSFPATAPTPLFGGSNPAGSNNASNNNSNSWANSQSDGVEGSSKDQTPYFAQNRVGGTGQVSKPPLTAEGIQNCPSDPLGASSGASCAIQNVIKYYNSLLWPK